jgi:hypothetical protein
MTSIYVSLSRTQREAQRGGSRNSKLEQPGEFGTILQTLLYASVLAHQFHGSYDRLSIF